VNKIFHQGPPSSNTISVTLLNIFVEDLSELISFVLLVPK
jgi:hypothetical protein